MIKELTSLVIGQEEERACPEGRSNERIDYFSHRSLAAPNINRGHMRVLANEGIRVQKGDVRLPVWRSL